VRERVKLCYQFMHCDNTFCKFRGSLSVSIAFFCSGKRLTNFTHSPPVCVKIKDLGYSRFCFLKTPLSSHLEGSVVIGTSFLYGFSFGFGKLLTLIKR
jgi:hypothetical protein